MKNIKRRKKGWEGETEMEIADKVKRIEAVCKMRRLRFIQYTTLLSWKHDCARIINYSSFKKTNTQNKVDGNHGFDEN